MEKERMPQNREQAYEALIMGGDIEKARQMKDQLLPSRLYHYTPFSIHWYSSVVAGQLFLNSPANFNDPYDCRIQGLRTFLINEYFQRNPDLDAPGIREDILDGEIKIAYGDARFTFEDYVEERCRQLKDRYSIACFSEAKDSVLMWSHYADCHRGLMLEMDVAKMPDKASLFKAVYSNTPVSISSVFEADHKLAFLLVKSTEWRYEREWRYVAHRGKEFLDVSSCISGIYLGARFERNQYPNELYAIGHFARSREIPLYRAQVDDEKYRIIYHPEKSGT